MSVIDHVFSMDVADKTDEEIFNCVDEKISVAMKNGIFSDSALDYFQYYFQNMKGDNNLGEVKLREIFLYRCLLEAIRLVALFHDVGHPPYSHIVEEVLQKLYYDENPTWDKKKFSVMKKCLEPFVDTDENISFQVHSILTNKAENKAPIHERIGSKLFIDALNDVIPNKLKSIYSSLSQENENEVFAGILYYIIVTEFAIAIISDTNNFFQSFHTIIDGTLDADRFDYIIRDSINSGVDWGRIPYKRLINSAMLFCPEKYNDEDHKDTFLIAYPEKMNVDIEDLLILRYKTFLRINFHHRSNRTAFALQNSLYEIARDYLSKKEDKDCINPEICMLWKVFSKSAGDKKLRIIQWNDSWLISVFQKALVNLNNNNSFNNKSLEEDLEEFLLKRGIDSKNFAEKILEKVDLTDEKRKSLYEKEQKKYAEEYNEKVYDENILSNKKSNARDSLIRLAKLDELKKYGDLEIIDKVFAPIDHDLKQLIEAALEKSKNEKKQIKQYKVFINKGRDKVGLPDHREVFKEIFLYREQGKPEIDQNDRLQVLIGLLRHDIPFISIYYMPTNLDSDINKIGEDILNEASEEIARALNKRIQELFYHSVKEDNNSDKKESENNKFKRMFNNIFK